MKLDTVVMMRAALHDICRVYWSPSKRVYCSFLSGNWSFMCADPTIAGAHKNCPAPFAEDWELLERSEPQRGDAHPTCDSCDHSMGYGRATVCIEPLLENKDVVRPGVVNRPALSYCSNHSAMRTTVRACPEGLGSSTPSKQVR